LGEKKRETQGPLVFELLREKNRCRGRELGERQWKIGNADLPSERESKKTL